MLTSPVRSQPFAYLGDSVACLPSGELAAYRAWEEEDSLSTKWAAHGAGQMTGTR